MQMGEGVLSKLARQMLCRGPPALAASAAACSPLSLCHAVGPPDVRRAEACAVLLL